MPNTFHIPPWPVDFEKLDEIDTTEVLEELDISLHTLLARRRKMGFPKPLQRGVNGHCALYDRREVEAWCEKHGMLVR